MGRDGMRSLSEMIGSWIVEMIGGLTDAMTIVGIIGTSENLIVTREIKYETQDLREAWMPGIRVDLLSRDPLAALARRQLTPLLSPPRHLNLRMLPRPRSLLRLMLTASP